jgi:hypothetical protein
MIQLLQLVRQYGHASLRRAIETGIELGCFDPGAIRHLVFSAELSRGPSIRIEVPELSCFDRPLPIVTSYDLLLTGESPQ